VKLSHPLVIYSYVSRIFGRFWGGVIGTPVFFCFNHSSHNAARPLCIRCTSTAHPLRIQPFRGDKTTLVFSLVGALLIYFWREKVSVSLLPTYYRNHHE
jgi:hypothetical protein